MYSDVDVKDKLGNITYVISCTKNLGWVADPVFYYKKNKKGIYCERYGGVKKRESMVDIRLFSEALTEKERIIQEEKIRWEDFIKKVTVKKIRY